jgi:hypothetical protein
VRPRHEALMPILLCFALHGRRRRFLNFSQSGDRPERWREPSRFDTIPSSPILAVETRLPITRATEGVSDC